MKAKLLISSVVLILSIQADLIAQSVDNPTGPTGVYNGNITTAGNYDPATGNQMRIVDDLVIPGSVGAYPLKWTRYWNTNYYNTISTDALWTFAYNDYKPNAMPDGRIIGADPSDGRGVPDYEGLDANGIPEIRLSDGGRVHFTPRSVSFSNPSYTFWYYQPTQLVDPYGQVTTMTYITRGTYPNSNPATPNYVLDRVTEPGGRYLQLTWQNAPPPNAGYTSNFPNVISRVEAFDGRGNSLGWVNYYWIASSDAHGIYPLIDHVTYADGTTAYYTYADVAQGLGGGTTVHWPDLFTANDVRYEGPMRQIAYGRANSSGQFVFAIASESNFNTHETLSFSAFDSWDAHQLPDGTWTETYVTDKETRADGATRTFTYSESCTWTHHPGDTAECDDKNNGKIIGYTDFLGHTTQISYETVTTGVASSGYLHSVTDPNGLTTTYTRSTSQDNTWNVTRVDYPDGSFITQSFTDDANPYYLASRTLQAGPSDPVRTISYTRDGNHRITRKNYPDGGYEEFTYNGFGEMLDHHMTSGGWEHFIYDTRGLKTSYTDATGGVTNYSYYTSGPWTDRIQTVTYPANASGFQANETYEYDRDSTGNPVAGRGLVTKVTHADGSTISKSYDKYGDLLTATDELGHTTTYTYDEYGRVLTTTDPLNNATTNSYVPTGLTSSTITTSKLPFSTTLPSGKQTTFEYDPDWRKRFVHVAPNTSDASTTEYRYDEGSGNVGHLTTMVDPRGNATTYGYDLRDRQISVTDALNHTTQVVYDTRGVKITETHANGELIEYDGYDAMNRLTHKKVHRNATTIDQVSISYDCAGNMIANIDENGNTYSYQYDSMNRPTVMTYPNGTTESHVYDAAGNVKTYTNRSGAVQTFSYDNRNRQTNFTWSDGTSSPTTSYDAASRKIEIDNADATITLGYDSDNRLTWQTEKEITPGVGDNIARTVAYTYDADGNRQSVQYPSGTKLDYAYTQRNQVQTITLDGQQAPIVTYGFDPGGNIASRSLDNGTSSAYTVDQVNRDSAVVHNLLPTGTTKRFDYAYNNVNDILAVQRDSAGGDGFTYDLTQQIIGFQQNGTSVNLSNGTVTGGTANTMTFDGCGNRTKLNGTAATFNNMNEQTSAGAVYDDATGPGNGNLASYSGWTYSYDAQNRLTTAAQNGTTIARFYYDGLNRQVARSLNGTKTFSVWDGDWAILEEYGSSNAVTQKYVQGYHGLVKTLVDNIYYYQDELGSTSHIANASGALLEYYKYNLYGTPKFFNASGSSISASSYSVKDLFTGQRWIKQISLYDDRNRFMSPALGRFLQPDPIGFKGDASNLYRYCGNDWANRTDPMGLDGYDAVHDFIGGIDEAVTFGLGKRAVNLAFPGYSSSFNQSSAAYRAGNMGGLVAGVLTGKTEAKLGVKAAQDAMARGRASEARVLQELGEMKNTAKVSGREGKSIPDFSNKNTIGEIKDVKKLTDSPQLRIQREAAQAQGKEHQIFTGTKTAVSEKAAAGSEVIRRPDLGPGANLPSQTSPGSSTPQASSAEPPMELSGWGAAGAVLGGGGDSKPAPTP
jgi:RHS repeat-associated protein